MTEVKFFFNVDNRLQFSCKLAKRAYDEGKRLIVYSPHLGKVEEFDRTLWTFSQLSFVPHVRSHHPLANETPIVVAMDESHLPHYDALLNLDDEPPPFFSRFEFLREVVSTDQDDRVRARERLKFYKSRGFQIEILDMAARKS